MIIISQSLLLAPSQSVDLTHPFLLWDNMLSVGMVEASSEAAGYPASNLVNVSTIERWQATSGETVEYLTITLGGDTADTIGIARHNFGSGLVSVAVQGREPDDVEWQTLCDDYLPADDRPIVFRFEQTLYTDLRLRLTPSGTAPRLAVLYAGVSLVLSHGIRAPHVPLDQAHDTQAVNGMSESGEFLGRIITGQSNKTSAQLPPLQIAWYYENMAPFIDRGASAPFFFAWLPVRRPRDVGYAWLSSDPRPSIGEVFVDVTLEIGGIVR